MHSLFFASNLITVRRNSKHVYEIRVHEVLVRKEDKHVLEILRNKTNVEVLAYFHCPPFQDLLVAEAQHWSSPRPIYTRDYLLTFVQLI